MSTPAVIIFRSREWDGINWSDVAYLSRRMDGHPDTCGRDLKSTLGGRRYTTITELIADVLRAQTVKYHKLGFSWTLNMLPKEQATDPAPSYLYILSLDYGSGPVMRERKPAKALIKVCEPKTLGSLEAGELIYDGPVNKFEPEAWKPA